MSKFSDFGLSVKVRLLQIGKDQKWLEKTVSENTGLFLDNGYMYKILTGQRKAPKIVAEICEVLEIQNYQLETNRDKQPRHKLKERTERN